ncbi:uncharacterized protein LOC141716953 [Apium graveolens]|uniref:uncharacterized protein LOC141716953 n=1 Tax=Apium graveolens TaxID=4045 RepID=UPI003D78F5DE
MGTWVGGDCCSWEGIQCNNVGHVIDLDLSVFSLTAFVFCSNFVCGCFESERQALLRFNQSRRHYDNDPMSTWVGGDCCSWERIQCNNAGHVTELRLDASSLTGDAMLGDGLSLIIIFPHKYSLTTLLLSNNDIGGPIPNSIKKLTSLFTLNIWENRLNGSLPEFLCHLSKLENLDVSLNELSGSIPKCIGGLSNLYVLDLSSNSWEGLISEQHFVNLTGLTSLSITSDSNLVFRVDSEWIPPFQLTELYLESVNMGSDFPSWVLTQRFIDTIWMGNTSISDANTIPADWFVSLLSRAYEVDLSHNDIYLPRPSFIPAPNNMTLLDLSNNHLSSDFPAYICNFASLYHLFLTNTNISGELPQCLGNLPSLRKLDVKDNNLSGDIPDFFNSLDVLEYLNLHNNKFEGKLPPSIQNATSLILFDLGNNNLRDILPPWTGEQLSDLMFLVLRNNHFYGSIPKQFCSYKSLQVLNLAGNHITGNLPPCFNNLTSMITTSGEIGPYTEYWDYDESLMDNAKGYELEYTSTLKYLFSIELSNNNICGEIPEELIDLRLLLNLNLAGNNLSGRIPDRIGKMEQLQYLDLSRNKLSGPIPRSVSELKHLIRLNLSYNDLSGTIPTGNQLQVLENISSIYAGNNQLCGQPILKPCAGDPEPQESHDKKEAGSGSHLNPDDERVWIYSGIGPGLLVGFLGFCASLHFIQSWSDSRFSSSVSNTGGRGIYQIWYHVEGFENNTFIWITSCVCSY